MEEQINVTNFNVDNIQAGKLYTLYYELTDEELNNKEQLTTIINNLWDSFMYNPTLDSNIHLDRNEKLITITTKLKDNLIFKTATDGLKSSVNILGQAVTNIVKNIINKEPIAVAYMPLTTTEAINEYKDYANTGNTIIQTITENPIIASVVDTTGNIVNAVNDTFKNTAKTLPYLPYILVGAVFIAVISYGNLKNIKDMFKR